ncbi:hypothetical protein POM88_027337 [Heracleum sosnowskyi]|uniref:MOSC domain-containing protein n=1 Tax=Heracleum sosnowskyi TaxID=360622 RepID=A0AAD8I9X0_9APIA|nr:hypothetical protein POM88_027337 [Heracleum sosnowskyi]
MVYNNQELMFRRKLEQEAELQQAIEYQGRRLMKYNSRPLPVYAPTPGYNLVFTDQYQFLMLSQGSLDALNNQLEEPLPVNRFRPSIFIDGCEPFAEDLWKEIKINNITFISIQLCPRCKVKYSTHWPSCFVLYTLNQAHFALVETETHRATPGGTGCVKTIGNYAAVLKAQSSAKAKGYSDVLYLDHSCAVFYLFHGAAGFKNHLD